MRLIDKLLGRVSASASESKAPSKKGSLAQELTDSGWKLSSRDEHALSIYERHCKDHSLSANRWDAGDWLKEFRGLHEESRTDQVEAARRSDSRER
jgi:hypothetical protein